MHHCQKIFQADLRIRLRALGCIETVESNAVAGSFSRNDRESVTVGHGNHESGHLSPERPRPSTRDTKQFRNQHTAKATILAQMLSIAHYEHRVTPGTGFWFGLSVVPRTSIVFK